jgi:hypothetical protein
MKKVAAAVAVAGGVLLLVVPRFVFPTCEQLGRGRMHCTDAAHAEYVLGALLVLAGIAQLLLHNRGPAIAAAAAAIALCAAALAAPSWTRYCANPDMPCHYGMVPSVRFTAGAVALVELAALIGLARGAARRGE